MHIQIAEALRQLKNAQEVYTRTVAEVQGACDHPLVDCVQTSSTRQSWTVGCGYGTASSGTPPYRLCKKCGMPSARGTRQITKIRHNFIPNGTIEADKLRLAQLDKNGQRHMPSDCVTSCLFLERDQIHVTLRNTYVVARSSKVNPRLGSAQRLRHRWSILRQQTHY